MTLIALVVLSRVEQSTWRIARKPTDEPVGNRYNTITVCHEVKKGKFLWIYTWVTSRKLCECRTE